MTSVLSVISAISLATNVANADPDEYQIDPAHTFVMFEVERFGFNTMIGIFQEVDGVLVLDEDNPEASRVEAHVSTSSLFSNDESQEGHVTGPSWLNADDFPQIDFISTGIELTGEDTARVTGDLTLLGETRAVTFDASLNKLSTDPSTGGSAVGMSISTMIDRTDFGLTTAAGAIGTDVLIRIELLAEANAE